MEEARDESDVARRESDAARDHAMALHEAAEAQRDHVTRCAAYLRPSKNTCIDVAEGLRATLQCISGVL